ncbi:MAG TPA: DUF6655 family protein [Candidatus Sulfotelmatobacter sp.]|nr:DUF6655 family protein [Candidatus Sulfotelmatobacter sp.]
MVIPGGCTTRKTTDTPRSATEQLLLSTATDRALHSANLMLFANRKVFLDATYFDSYDSKYVLGEIRDALSRAGALLQDTAANSDIIIEARSGALATDNSATFFGVPTFAVPIPLAGSVSVPEVAFYKVDRQHSIAKIALLAFAKASREHIYSSGPLDGKSHDSRYQLLFISWVHMDIPEEQKTEEKGEQYQTWYPEYDESNLPPISAPATNAPAPASANISTNNANASTNSVNTATNNTGTLMNTNAP